MPLNLLIIKLGFNMDVVWRKFRFQEFYGRLSAKGFVIYPGTLSRGDCFRIGNIGHIFPADIRNLLAAIRDILGEMQVAL
jgi:2-aminoethylphosphonate-pyruvate transaminase